MAGRQKTLLCVDDNQSSLNICKIILENFGYQVLTASSAREGLGMFASNVIDAVILDYQMPEMNGELVSQRDNPGILQSCGECAGSLGPGGKTRVARFSFSRLEKPDKTRSPCFHCGQRTGYFS